MSKRHVRALLEDILDAIFQACTYVDDLDEEAFSIDRKTQDAVVRNLEIIGEAASRLPEDYRAANQDIPWALMRGLRNRIVHAYFGVDFQIVWQVLQEDLPPLKEKIIILLEAEKPN